MNSSAFASPVVHGNSSEAQDSGKITQAMLSKLVQDLLSPKNREAALAELSKHRESIDNLAVVLWNTFGMYLFHSN